MVTVTKWVLYNYLKHFGSEFVHRKLKKVIMHFVEKEMATHSSTLAWKIPWVEEPGGLQSMGSLRVGHD